MASLCHRAGLDETLGGNSLLKLEVGGWSPGRKRLSLGCTLVQEVGSPAGLFLHLPNPGSFVHQVGPGHNFFHLF